MTNETLQDNSCSLIYPPHAANSVLLLCGWTLYNRLTCITATINFYCACVLPIPHSSNTFPLGAILQTIPKV